MMTDAENATSAQEVKEPFLPAVEQGEKSLDQQLEQRSAELQGVWQEARASEEEMERAKQDLENIWTSDDGDTPEMQTMLKESVHALLAVQEKNKVLQAKLEAARTSLQELQVAAAEPATDKPSVEEPRVESVPAVPEEPVVAPEPDQPPEIIKSEAWVPLTEEELLKQSVDHARDTLYNMTFHISSFLGRVDKEESNFKKGLELVASKLSSEEAREFKDKMIIEFDHLRSMLPTLGTHCELLNEDLEGQNQLTQEQINKIQDLIPNFSFSFQAPRVMQEVFIQVSAKNPNVKKVAAPLSDFIQMLTRGTDYIRQFGDFDKLRSANEHVVQAKSAA